MDQLKTSPAQIDQDFICAIREGGTAADKAIMSLYATHQKDIRAFIYTLISRYGHQPNDASDMVHDSFIVMLHKIRFEHLEITSLRSFWMGIAKHVWLNRNKRRNRIDLVEDRQEDYNLRGISPEDLLIEEERLDRIRRCICNCGGRCHEILTLWLADYSMDEIAEKLNLSSAAMARKIKHECFKKLKDMLINSNIFSH